MLATLLLLAEEAPNTAPQTPWFYPLLLPVAIVFLFYFLLMRPERRREQQRQMLAANLKKGDKVVTSSGIIGTVVAVAEKEDEVTVKVDDNVRLKMLKGSILRNVTQEEALQEQKGQKQAEAKG